MGQSRKGKVTLKNGSVVKGKITESDTKESVRIQSSGNLWVFAINEIDKIDYLISKTGKPDLNKNSNFSNHTQVGVLIGNNNDSPNAPFMLHSSLNYKLSNKLQIGLGTGIEFLKETHMPIFATAEYRFRDAMFSPYIFLKAGYTIPIEDSRTIYYDVVPYSSSSSFWPGPWQNNEVLNAKGGVLLNPGFGITNMFSSNFGISLAVGYRFTRLHYNGEKNYQLDIDYNRLSITVGIIFN
jgi:hypothetical protein